MTDHGLVLLEHVAAGRGRDLETLDGHRARRAVLVHDATIEVLVFLLAARQRLAETRNPQESRPPVGEHAEVVYEPFEGGLRLGEGGRGHHQSTKGNLAGKIDR